MKTSSSALVHFLPAAILAAGLAWLPCHAIEQNAPAATNIEKPLETLNGPTLQVLVVWGLMQTGVAAEEAKALAADIKFQPKNTLTDTVSAINGIPSRSGKFRRTLTLQIISQNVQAAPGGSAETMDALQKSLASGAPIIADLVRKSWRPRDGALPDEIPKEGKTTRTQREETQRVLLALDPKQNLITCRMANGPRSKTATISLPELTAAISSYAAVRIAASQAETQLESFPKDFRFNVTLIKPGHYAYLAVPYERQAGGSICSAAAALNILHFIDPELNLEQREVRALYNQQSSGGASPPQILAGIQNLGYEAVMVQPKDIDKISLMAKVRTCLEAGQPMLVTTPKHALTLIGYNKSAGTLIFWDQRMETPGTPAPLPAGAVEANEDTLRARMTNIIFIHKNGVGASPSADESNSLTNVLGKSVFLRHELINANPQTSFKVYLRHACISKISDLLNRNRSVVIPTNDKKSPFLEIIGKVSDDWIVIPQPSEKQVNLSTGHIADALESSNGVFFSRPITPHSPR